MHFFNHGRHRIYGSFANACVSVASVISVVRTVGSHALFQSLVGHTVLFAMTLFSLVGDASAQEISDRKRFKHEKHGAIVFASGIDYELKCDMYVPESDEPRPVMLAIHGGAWTTGTKFAMFRHARILANRGYVVMAINYRLAPDHKWPAQIHDCKHAVRWIREHAKEYNADPDRVYAFGYSAGGHLASLLATTDNDDGLEGEPQEPYSKHSTRIQGLIAGGSPMEFGWIGEDSTTFNYWMDATRASDPEKYANASPTTYITQDDPVAVLFHGTSDNLVPTSSPETFIQCCDKANVDADLILASCGHAAAFTKTSLFIESLAKLEAMLAKKKCLERISSIVELVRAYIESNGHLPESVNDLGEFAAKVKEIEPSAFEKIMFNERDGKLFEIRWSSQPGPIVSEAIGVNGEKLSSQR